MLSIEKIREAIEASGVDIDAQNLPVDATFQSMGLDSLDFYNIILEVQQIAEFEIPDEDISDLRTIAGIYQYFKNIV